MKKILFLIVLAISTPSIAQHEQHQAKLDSTKPKPKSPRLVVMNMVGTNHVHIDYGSPSVRGRKIWNGLVAFDQVWATGAHKATWIEFSEDVKINEQLVPKGKYGFFTIPNKKQWTVVLSKDWNMHLADDYKPENDQIRITIKPKKVKNIAESLQFEVREISSQKGQIKLAWEYLSVSFEFANVVL